MLAILRGEERAKLEAVAALCKEEFFDKPDIQSIALARICKVLKVSDDATDVDPWTVSKEEADRFYLSSLWASFRGDLHLSMILDDTYKDEDKMPPRVQFLNVIRTKDLNIKENLGEFKEVRENVKEIAQSDEDHLQVAEFEATILRIMMSKRMLGSGTKRLIKQTLHTRKKILGKDHVDTLRSACDEAVYLERIQKYNEAMDLNGSLLKRSEMVLGVCHPLTIQVPKHYAHCYQAETLDFDEGIELLTECQGRAERTFGLESKQMDLIEKLLDASYEGTEMCEGIYSSEDDEYYSSDESGDESEDDLEEIMFD